MTKFSDFLRRNEVVACETCGVLLKKESAGKVRVEFGGYTVVRESLEFFCKTHCPLYTKKRIYSWLGMPATYYKEMQVDENGEPIGYVKEEKKVEEEKEDKK